MIGNQFRRGLRPANSYPAGARPWNAGTTGIRCSPDSEFKPGGRGIHWVPIGTERSRRGRGDKPRVWVKVAEPNVWRMRAVVVYEAANGPLPRGSVVHHKDRDTTHDDLANLEAMTRAEHINEHRQDLRP